MHDGCSCGLKEANQLLRDRVVELEALLGLKRTVPRALGFTPREEEIVGLLLKLENISREQMMVAMYGDRPEPPDWRILDTFMCRVRKRLRRADIDIVTVWGRGWLLTKENKAKLAKLLEAENG